MTKSVMCTLLAGALVALFIVTIYGITTLSPWTSLFKNFKIGDPFKAEVPKFRADGSPLWAPENLTPDHESAGLVLSTHNAEGCYSDSRFYSDAICVNECFANSSCFGYTVLRPLNFCYLCFSNQTTYDYRAIFYRVRD